LVASAVNFPSFNRSTHRAAKIGAVLAVVESAILGEGIQIGKARTQAGFIRPKLQLANSGIVD